MALEKCEESSNSIAENADDCPTCECSHEHPKAAKKWFEMLNAIGIPLVSGIVSAIVAAGGMVLACAKFVHQTDNEDTERFQAIIEAAVSNDQIKERAAVRVVSYLAKSNKISPSVALSIVGTLARNEKDGELRSEAFEALENLPGQIATSPAKLDLYDQLEHLEILCLQAALTPAQYWRQKNLRKVEEFVEKDSTDPELKFFIKSSAAAKLLSLSREVSNAQAAIDLLLSMPARLDDPDIIEQEVPLLCKAIKDRSDKLSNEDVVDCIKDIAKKSSDVRSRIRLYLACALVARAKEVQENSLHEVAQLVKVQIKDHPKLAEDAEQFLDGIITTAEFKSVANEDLKRTLETARTYLRKVS